MAKKKKDWGENSKSSEARARKAASKEEQQRRRAKEDEDAYWKAAGEGSKTKAQAKREEQERRRTEAAAKKAEVRRMAKEEEDAMIASSSGASKAAKRVALPKVTQHELRLQAETQRKKDEEATKERSKAAKHEVDEESYARLVDARNTNRDEDTIDARTIDQALSFLEVADTEEDQHPEKRRKAAFLAFEERELPRLKEEKPGLKQSQYREKLFKLWQKSPENPMNSAN